MEAGFVALGLVQGALAALNTVGIVLLWRTTRVVNVAQPALGLVGGVLCGLLVAGSGWSFWWAAPVGVACGAVLGFASERLVLSRLGDVPRVVPLVATIGIAQLLGALQSGLPFAFGGRLPSYDVDLGMELYVFPVLLKGPHLLALGVLPVAVAGIWAFLHRSRIGVAALATGQDAGRAMALGIDVDVAGTACWTVAGALSGVAGVLAVPVLGFSLGDGVAPTVLLLALAPAVLAGLRNVVVAAAAALLVGVAYQAALVLVPTAGSADVLLGALVVAAVALQRRQLARDEDAGRRGSWAAATSPRTLASRVRTDVRWRGLTAAGAAGAVVVAALPPLWLGPASDVRYGTGAALVLAAVACSAAWTFAGEVVLGHWGIAALGAGIAFAAPGPLLARATLAVLVGSAVGAALTSAGRRRGGLGVALAGLALAVAAPTALGTPTGGLGFAAGSAAPAAGAVTALAVVGLLRLRASRAGVRLVAARDQPRRAAGFAIDAGRARAAGMAMSGAAAALAGVLYAVCVPAGIAPGAFDPDRSLDVLALAVVGGLGSPLAAAIGAAAVLASGASLPPPWGDVAVGTAVLWVVLLSPAGVSAITTRVRDRLAAWVTGNRVGRSPARADQPGPADDPVRVRDPGVEVEARVAGADTREAAATPSVRASAATAALVAAPALAGVAGAPSLLRDHLGVTVAADLRPWVVLGLGLAAGAAAAAGWASARRQPPGTELSVIAGALLATGAFVVTGDRSMLAVVAVVGVPAAAHVLGRTVALVGTAVPHRARSAAYGIVVAAGLGGSVGSAHLALVAAGGDLLDASRWAVGYLAAGALAAATALSRLPGDRRRARAMSPAVAPRGRRVRVPLRVEHLAVGFGHDASRAVLDDVGFEVRAGELVALLGVNGTGKSTLLRSIAGLVPVRGGRVEVDGTDLSGLATHERAAAGLAFVDGARPVFPDLTVAENLRAAAHLSHRSGAAHAEATAHVLAAVPALAARLDARAGQLSGGQQRLLAVAQTLYRTPTVLLVDELALGLDAQAKATTLQLLRTLADAGIAVVAVEHDLDALLAIADRAVTLQSGRTIETDIEAVRAAPQELLAPTFLAGAAR